MKLLMLLKMTTTFGLIVLTISAFMFVIDSDQMNFAGIEFRLMGPLSVYDTDLIQYIRESVLAPPSEEKYNLELDKTTPGAMAYNSYRKSQISWMYLHDKLRTLYPPGSRKGFFVEAGAFDGEFNSNTLYLEKDLRWTGLLVEPDKELVQMIHSKNRRSWTCHCCLATKEFPYQTLLTKTVSTKSSTRLFNSLSESRSNRERAEFGYIELETVQCFPLQSLLAALNRTHVDLISLDVEDLEDEIIGIFPFDRITVDVWLIEHRSPSSQFVLQVDKLDQIIVDRFRDWGYDLYDSYGSPRDYIFIKRNFLSTKSTN